MKIWNRIEAHGQLPMADRARVSGTLADWRSEANIKRAFGRVWFSHCGAAYDMRPFRGTPRSSVRAIYYEPRAERMPHKSLLVVFDGVSYEIEPMTPMVPMEFKTERQILARNLSFQF